MTYLSALKNNQRQLDMDGCEVGVSRQALDEAIAFIEAALFAADAEPVVIQWCGYEDGHQCTRWYNEGSGHRSEWEIWARRNPDKYQILTRPLFTAPLAVAVKALDDLCRSPIIEAITPTTEEWDACETIQDRYDLMKRRIRSALVAPADTSPEDPDEETYEIGKRDGFSEAVQQIDQLTGGDGEYRYCTDHDPDRHTPGPAEMIQRIVDRFETLSLLDDATKTGRDQPDDVPADTSPEPVIPEGWQLVPKQPTKEMAYQAACAHYGAGRVNACGGIEGISMTVDSVDYNFWRAFRRFWKGALAAVPKEVGHDGD